MVYLIYNNYVNINDNNNLKRKYYQLLIDSFKIDSTNDKIKEKKNIIKLFEESELKNFQKLDNFLMTLDSIFINEKTNSSDRDLFSSENQNKINDKNLIESGNDLEENFLPDDSQQNQIIQMGLVDSINSKQFEYFDDKNETTKENNLL